MSEGPEINASLRRTILGVLATVMIAFVFGTVGYAVWAYFVQSASLAQALQTFFTALPLALGLGLLFIPGALVFCVPAYWMSYRVLRPRLADPRRTASYGAAMASPAGALSAVVTASLVVAEDLVVLGAFAGLGLLAGLAIGMPLARTAGLEVVGR